MRVARRALASAQLAFGLLTVIPVRAGTATEGIGESAAWFPLVGALVGAAAGGVRLAADHALGPGVAGTLAVITLVVLTGGLHQDGLADCADALGVRGGRDRRLEVMRDSTVGAYGVLALALWGLLFVAAAAALPYHDALRTLLTAGALGRWAAVLHAAALPPARRDGLGVAFSPGPTSVVIATGLAVATVALSPLAGLAALAAAVVVTAAASTLARRGLGGRTGDTLGATVALTEVTVCVVLLGFAR
jgi:adenosylcobinamide-GDP ribazoletransferase